MKTPLLFVAALLLTGCASGPPVALKTPSGRPEILIHAPMQKVRSSIIALEVGGGAKLIQQSENSLTFGIASTNFATNLMYGSRLSPIPMSQSSYTLIQESGGVRVFVFGEIVTNPGTAFQSTTRVDATEVRKALQGYLERIKKNAEGGS